MGGSAEQCQAPSRAERPRGQRWIIRGASAATAAAVSVGLLSSGAAHADDNRLYFQPIENTTGDKEWYTITQVGFKYLPVSNPLMWNTRCEVGYFTADTAPEIRIFRDGKSPTTQKVKHIDPMKGSCLDISEDTPTRWQVNPKTGLNGYGDRTIPYILIQTGGAGRTGSEDVANMWKAVAAWWIEFAGGAARGVSPAINSNYDATVGTNSGSIKNG